MSKNNSVPQFRPDEFHYRFDHKFPHHGNALFEDDGRLFIGNVINDTVKDIEEVSLVEALEWYTLLIQIAPESEGTMELLCRMAAKELSQRNAFTGGSPLN